MHVQEAYKIRIETIKAKKISSNVKLQTIFGWIKEEAANGESKMIFDRMDSNWDDEVERQLQLLGYTIRHFNTFNVSSGIEISGW